MLTRSNIAKFFQEGYWRRPLYTYRLWRMESHRWGSMKSVWEHIGRDRQLAFMMINNSQDEAQLQATGRQVAEGLTYGLKIEPQHRVLEIGCGVARIGRELAPHCGEWWGCDISGSIIRLARQRTAHLPNVHLQVQNDSSLRNLAGDSFDRVYCHAVFMHMDQENIFHYLQETQRVLRPGGLALYDAMNLTNTEGWTRFLWEIEHYKGRTARPIHHSRFSTPQEMIVFTEKAGLGLVYCGEPKIWVQVVAAKYPEDCTTGEERQAFLGETRRQIDLEALRAV